MTRKEAHQMLKDVDFDSGGLDYDGADNWWTWRVTTDEFLRVVEALKRERS